MIPHNRCPISLLHSVDVISSCIGLDHGKCVGQKPSEIGVKQKLTGTYSGLDLTFPLIDTAATVDIVPIPMPPRFDFLGRERALET